MTQNATNVYEELAKRLAQPLDPSLIRRRQGPGGRKLDYLAGPDVMRALNDALAPIGPLGWSRHVDRLTSSTEGVVDPKTQRVIAWNAVATALVTIELHPGGVTITRHQDVGHGLAQKAKTLGEAIELAEKAAVTDAVKRAARAFGPRMGLALYDGAEERGELAADEPEEDAPEPQEDRRPVEAPAPEWERGGPREGTDRRAGTEKPVEADPKLHAARWLLELTLAPEVTAELRAGRLPDDVRGTLLDGCLPPEPTREELVELKPLHPDALEDLLEWPAKDALTRPLLVEVHEAAVAALGEDETKRLWSELGVELRRGAVVTGYQARLLVAGAGAAAKTRR